MDLRIKLSPQNTVIGSTAVASPESLLPNAGALGSSKTYYIRICISTRFSGGAYCIFETQSLRRPATVSNLTSRLEKNNPAFSGKLPIHFKDIWCVKMGLSVNSSVQKFMSFYHLSCTEVTWTLTWLHWFVIYWYVITSLIHWVPQKAEPEAMAFTLLFYRGVQFKEKAGRIRRLIGGNLWCNMLLTTTKCNLCSMRTGPQDTELPLLKTIQALAPV